MKLAIILAAVLIPTAALAQVPFGADSGSCSRQNCITISGGDTAPSILLRFQVGRRHVDILPNGRVVLPKGVPLTRDAKAFWNAVESVRGLPPLFPGVK